MLAGLCAASTAAAQTYTVTIASTGIPLGNVASGLTGNTTFAMSASSGSVTRLAGTGERISTASTARVLVTVACGNQGSCNSVSPYIRVGTTGVYTGRASLLYDFTIQAGTGVVQSQSGSNPVNFRLNPIGQNSSKTFYVGGTLAIEGDNSPDATGAATAGFYVYAKATSPPTSGDSDTVRATVYRKVSIAKNSDLDFGRVVRPLTGTATVAVNATTGVRTVGTAVALASPTPTRATYTVTGEPSRVVSVTAPDFSMNGPGGASVAVVTTPSVTNLSLGTGGSATFGVGGSFPLSSTQAGGSYSGSFTVTVDYN